MNAVLLVDQFALKNAAFEVICNMFTGIIEKTGRVAEMRREGTNLHFRFQSQISSEFKVDQSVSHNGVCLTVTRVDADSHWVTAIDETLKKSNLGTLAVGTEVNLERCLLSNGRFDGHIVQGHVDQIAVVSEIVDQSGSWLYTFEYDASQGNITVEKGSIAVNGVSLTCFNSNDNSFTVAIIPYTYEHTNFHYLKKGDSVNLEFDIVGKYVKRLLSLSGR
jgi:riboflavin synthase